MAETADDFVQFKFRIESDLLRRLSKAAERAGYSSPNQFALAALDQYAELLADLINEQREQAKNLRDEQRERLLGEIAEALAKAESSRSKSKKSKS